MLICKMNDITASSRKTALELGAKKKESSSSSSSPKPKNSQVIANTANAPDSVNACNSFKGL